MIRGLIGLLLPGCTVAPEPRSTDGLATTGDVDPRYRSTFQVEDDPPITDEVRGLSMIPLVGDDCSPSFWLYSFSNPNDFHDDVNTNLIFHEPPEVGVSAPLPDAAAWTGLASTQNPVWVHLWEGRTNAETYTLFGGRVRVVTLDPDLWELVFEGEGLVVCDEHEENCVPITHATLAITPAYSAVSLPEASLDCVEGEPYPWPDGGDGCGILETADRFTGCPETFPW